MRKEKVGEDVLWIVSPFERPDVRLLCAAAKAGAYPVLHLGRNPCAAQQSVDELASRLDVFGVCAADGAAWEIDLPDNVNTLILPWGTQRPTTSDAEVVWQVRTVDEAMEALETTPTSLIIKGCESAGIVGDDSAFILFQRLISPCQASGVSVYVQGGVGVHTASAYMALGASGVVLDSQLALFGECSLGQETKIALRRMSGDEIRQCGHYRYYIAPADKAEAPLAIDDLYTKLSNDDSPILPLGQDVILSVDLADEHKRLTSLVEAIKHGVATHVNQARISDPFSSTARAASTLGTTYPITQGPMSRISDVPEFLDDVAEAGALPFLAMGLEQGQTAQDMLQAAAQRLKGKPWGAGILGFALPSILADQTQYILKAKPSHVLIAGGRPGQEKVFEQAGITVLMHAPSTAVLDLLITSGASSFIFEGRESGGHVGPLYSSVLWEKQIAKLLSMPDPSELLVLFAGGIHDTLSAAFVRIMAAPLTARGVKVGIQCGTAYLYTREAVASGAITKAYQELLVNNDKTYLLTSAYGQETRCVRSPFTDMFEKEKVRMEEEGLAPAEILNKLELLNLGRLRVASKGIGRENGQLIELTPAQQNEQGLYMTGAVTELTHTTTSIADLHKELMEGSWEVVTHIQVSDNWHTCSTQPDIAIIGMAGIFPGAENVDEFWRNIVFGKDCITEVSPDRWSADTFFDPNSSDTEYTVSKWGGFIGATDFNALEFGMPPESVPHIEPQQLLALLVAKRALDDAGLADPSNPDLEETSVFFGVDGAGELIKSRNIRTVFREIMGDLPPDLNSILPQLTEYEFPSFLTNVTAGRISNRLNTCGRNFAVDAACAASLAALDIAMTELRTYKAEMAIVGGADLHNRIEDYLGFNSIGALSPQGRCATFDTDADGLAISEGVCAVVLKRLDDARRDNNTIYAVIKGIGGSSDGRSLGLTAPSKRGQLLSLERAYADAGVRPRDVGMIEAHGTGTALGDWTEVSALTQFYLEDGAEPGSISLGSLKSMIGHTKTAAGVSGLIKAALCVQHGVLPPTLHLNTLNKAFGPYTPFNLRTDKAGHWNSARRIAGVSAFGFGGTNFHAIVENYEPQIPDVALTSWPTELFVFPGSTPHEAEILMDKVTDMLGLNDKLRLIDIAYSLSLRCIAKQAQYAIVAGTREELLDRMKLAREGNTDENIHRLDPVEGKVAFLFPGQGSQRVNMAADLFTVFPRMRRMLNEHPDYERVLYPPSAFTDDDKQRQREDITDTRNAQPLLGIVDMAIADLLKDFGIVPDVVVGHSYGELPALCYAGAIDDEDLVGLSRDRAEATLASITHDKGRMAAVLTDKATLRGLLDGMDGVWPVNFNAPRQIVVAGTSSGMDAFLNKAQIERIAYKELDTDCAFHSPLLQGADSRFAEAMTEVRFHEPAVPVISNLDAEYYPADDQAIHRRLVQHLMSPVLFADDISAVADAGVTIFIEAGPGGALTQLVPQTVKDCVCIRMEDCSVNGLTFFLQGLARYISTGRTVKMSELFKGRGAEALYIEDPQANKKDGLIFTVTAKCALPEGGEPPKTNEQLAAWFDNALSNNGPAGLRAGDTGAERVMLAYMNNMGNLIENMGSLIGNMDGLIHDQRDAVLGYLGVADVAPRRMDVRGPAADPPAITADAVDETNAPPAEDEPVSAATMTTEQVTQLIFEVVSEKTGYPVSMLNLDTDLEADLSIDSIKKMEIVSELGHRFNMPAGSEAMETSFEKIISIKTFRDLATWIESVIHTDGVSDDDSGTLGKESAAGDEDDDVVLPPVITRVVFTEKSCPVTGKNMESIRGKNFALTDDGGGLAQKAAEKIQSFGAGATIIGTGTDLTGFDGLVLIASGANRCSVLDLFSLIKRMDMDKLEWVLALDDSLGACLNATTGDDLSLPSGFSGFLATLHCEYPGKNLRSVQSETLFNPQTFAEMVTDELTATKHVTDVVYRQGSRLIRVPEKQDVNTHTPSRTVLDKDSVVLVLGGAQGITPHVVRRLAEDVPCLYVLVGRSVRDPGNEAYDTCETVDDIKRVLIHKEGMASLREINATAQRIHKSKQITKSLALIEEAGAKAVYMNADVTDPESFGALIESVQTQYGPIEGAIHAAGVVEDKLFRDKQYDSFARVYNTKVAPLATVENKLLPGLKLLVLFSSVVADFGNPGQCDYAAGNAVLNDAARMYTHLYPDMKVVAFNWGPWSGAGMVDSALERESAKKGMGFIGLDAGADFCAEELAHGNDAVVVALSMSEPALQSFVGTLDEHL